VFDQPTNSAAAMDGQQKRRAFAKHAITVVPKEVHREGNPLTDPLTRNSRGSADWQTADGRATRKREATSRSGGAQL